MSGPSLQGAALVLLGGSVGSALRYLLASWVSLQVAGQIFPWGTFAVNIIGCAVGGAVAALSERSAWLTSDWRLFLFTGILGGFTTFSAFGLETMNLMRQGQAFTALMYVTFSVVLGVAAMYAVYSLTLRA